MKIRTWVGLDVHAHRSHLAILDAETGELRRRRVEGPPSALVELLGAEAGPLRAVYAAGPTGFSLARLGAERGLDVRVCAPGLVPRRPTDRVKTDAKDAERLARLLAAGELAFVCVPTLAQEQLRDLVRAREDLREDLMRARHRLSKFCLRRELRFSGGLDVGSPALAGAAELCRRGLARGPHRLPDRPAGAAATSRRAGRGDRPRGRPGAVCRADQAPARLPRHRHAVCDRAGG